MSSSEFKYIIIEIPKNITLELVKDIRESIKNISVHESVLINSLINIDLEEIVVTDIDEEDLFDLGEDALRIKKGVQSILSEAVNIVFLPRVNIGKRLGAPVHNKEFSYLELGDKLYAISGNQTSLYGSRVSNMYMYLLALNLSGILDRISNNTQVISDE